MDNNNLKFPDFFPEECPPNDAKGEEITVYRFCEGKIPTEKDFLSLYEINPLKNNDVRYYGLSVYPTKETCIHAQKLSPNLKRKKGAASGVTYYSTGKIKRTPSRNSLAHITWWLYEGVKPHTYFKPCELRDAE